MTSNLKRLQRRHGGEENKSGCLWVTLVELCAWETQGRERLARIDIWKKKSEVGSNRGPMHTVYIKGQHEVKACDGSRLSLVSYSEQPQRCNRRIQAD